VVCPLQQGTARSLNNFPVLGLQPAYSATLLGVNSCKVPEFGSKGGYAKPPRGASPEIA